MSKHVLILWRGMSELKFRNVTDLFVRHFGVQAFEEYPGQYTLKRGL